LSSPPPPCICPKSIKLNRLLKDGNGVYLEYADYLSRAGVQPKKATLERIFVKNLAHYITQDLGHLKILEEHDSFFLPIEIKDGEEILSYGLVAGTHRVIYDLPEESHPALVSLKKGRGRLLVASTTLSAYSGRKYKLTADWESLARRMMLYLLPRQKRLALERTYLPLAAHTEPRVWGLPGEPVRVVVKTSPAATVSIKPKKDGIRIRTSMGPMYKIKEVPFQVADRDGRYLKALERNIGWFQKSGIMDEPDGSAGVRERFYGVDYKGSYTIAENVRTDCNFETALAFYLYGVATKKAQYKKVGYNILQNMFKGRYQDMDETRPTYGFWSWLGPFKEHPEHIYADDESWAAICLLDFHRRTKDEEYLRRGLLTARALLDTQGVTGLRPAHISGEELLKNGRGWYAKMEDGDFHSHFNGMAISAFLYTYGATEDEKYLQMAIKGTDTMLRLYSTIDDWVISKTAEYSRFLLPLSMIYYYTKDARYKEALDRVGDYLFSHQVACGAIQEWDNTKRESFGKGDIGVFHENGEPISDQLYTTSFAAMNLFIAYKATGERKWLESFFKLADYLVRIQDRSGHPQTDGAWMRAFDFENWEYFGSNGDVGWGPYCLETGWCNAIIDIALGLYLTDDPFLPLLGGLG
jgi:hypothetical protein